MPQIYERRRSDIGDDEAAIAAVDDPRNCRLSDDASPVVDDVDDDDDDDDNDECVHSLTDRSSSHTSIGRPQRRAFVKRLLVLLPIEGGGSRIRTNGDDDNIDAYAVADAAAIRLVRARYCLLTYSGRHRLRRPDALVLFSGISWQIQAHVFRSARMQRRVRLGLARTTGTENKPFGQIEG
jgi:hypothetical protein